MKFSQKMALAVAMLCGVVSQSWAHIFSFTNHMPDRNVQVAVQLGGMGEPWYLVGPNMYASADEILEPTTNTQTNTILKPNATESVRFVAGEGPEDYSRKFGFCLARIQVRYQRADGEWSGWLQIAPRFIETEKYQSLSQAAAGIFGAVQSGVESLTDPAAISALKMITDSKVLANHGELPEAPLAEFIREIAKVIAYSSCRERKFEIFSSVDREEEKGFYSVGGPVIVTLAE